MQTFQPQIVYKGLLMCIMVCDLILKFEVYKIIIFKKYQKLHVAFFVDKNWYNRLLLRGKHLVRVLLSNDI